MFTFRLAVACAAVGTCWSADLSPIARPSDVAGGLRITAPAQPGKPWTVAGEHGALFGRQNGVFEAWQWPVKLFSNFRIHAELANYAVPIDVNALAAQIDVTPAETVITYSHAAFTIRQHMFAARGGQAGSIGAALYFEVQSARPLALTFSFTPDVLTMWPAPNHGRPNAEWIAEGSSGFYILHTDDPDFSGLVAMPRTQPGIMVPYQEHPQTFPVDLKLSFDPKADGNLVFPLTFGLLKNPKNAAEEASRIQAAAMAARNQTIAYYQHFFDTRLIAHTPDRRIDEGLRWAEVSVDQGQVDLNGETGMVAGYYESADSARPGYGWFFGRDTLFTTYAINSSGDFALTRRALEFLLKRQRDDGKIMHEYSQAAGQLDWKSTPYFYASADSTPLLVMAAWDYVRMSGDKDFLQGYWEPVKKAYAFVQAHLAANGIYSNKEGTGWVEAWPGVMPKQEIYLAAVDEQASLAMAHLAALENDNQLASDAATRAKAVDGKIEAQFALPDRQGYAFSRNDDGSLDQTDSIYPALAWWDGTYRLKESSAMLTRWADHDISTDWGTRDISARTSFYDPISYHQGSVWPLFTGWVSVAEYRAGRTYAGYAHLMQNLNLTWAQDLGSVTELLSGEFYQPLGRSSSHQTWSSAMVTTPLVRGLFGVETDSLSRTIQVQPHLPADWGEATLENVALGADRFKLHFQREKGHVAVTATAGKPVVFCLVASAGSTSNCSAAPTTAHSLVVALPPVELAVPSFLPNPGSVTGQWRVADQQPEDHGLALTLEGMGGAAIDVPLALNRTGVRVEGGVINSGHLQLTLPLGSGFQTARVTFRW